MKDKFKKIGIGVFILLFVFLFKLPSASAASCKIGVSAPNQVIVGKSFKVTVTVSSNASLGSWEYTLSYDSSKVKLNSGSLRVVDYGNGSSKSRSYSYTFTALKSGTATFKPVNASILDYSSTNECLSGVGSDSVTMKTQAEIEASYSKNNNLSSLSVEGVELSPAFDPNTLEYSATLPVDTTKAIINASVQDSKATVAGTGEVSVVDGPNKIEVVVTAQNGDKKTYVINITVEELDPIEVKVEGKKYTIVRKSGQVENIPVGFSETKVKIKDQDITAYKSDITKLTLVALKDEEGKISLFVYNSSSNEFSSFKELKGASTNLILLDKPEDKVPDGFVKTTFKYKEEDINGFKLKDGKDENFYLVYAQNLETGSKGFYLYDKKDNTFQKYFGDLVEIKNEQIKIMSYIIFALSGLIILFILVKLFSVLFTSKQKRIKKYEKKLSKLKNNIHSIEEDDEDNYDITKVDEEPVVTKIEDEYEIPKKSKKEKKKELEEARKRLEKNKRSYRRLSLEEDDDE